MVHIYVVFFPPFDKTLKDFPEGIIMACTPAANPVDVVLECARKSPHRALVSPVASGWFFIGHADAYLGHRTASLYPPDELVVWSGVRKCGSYLEFIGPRVNRLCAAPLRDVAPGHLSE